MVVTIIYIVTIYYVVSIILQVKIDFFLIMANISVSLYINIKIWLLNHVENDAQLSLLFHLFQKNGCFSLLEQ